MFVDTYLRWQSKILSISIDRCFSVSFGFPNDLGVSMLELNVDVDVESWNREILGHADDCFLVFVGGNYIDMLDQVAEKVGSIGKKLQTKARAIIIDRKESRIRNISETWPPLVCILIY